MKSYKVGRSKSITDREEALLRDLLQAESHIIENKRVNKDTNKKKKDAWERIAIAFNSEPCVHKRTESQLINWWKNSKKAAKDRRVSKREINQASDAEDQDDDYPRSHKKEKRELKLSLAQSIIRDELYTKEDSNDEGNEDDIEVTDNTEDTTPLKAASAEKAKRSVWRDGLADIPLEPKFRQRDVLQSEEWKLVLVTSNDCPEKVTMGAMVYRRPPPSTQVSNRTVPEPEPISSEADLKIKILQRQLRNEEEKGHILAKEKEKLELELVILRKQAQD